MKWALGEEPVRQLKVDGQDVRNMHRGDPEPQSLQVLTGVVVVSWPQAPLTPFQAHVTSQLSCFSLSRLWILRRFFSCADSFLGSG